MVNNRYAILIASSQFKDGKLENLRFPENDVDGLNEILESENFGYFTKTFVLKNEPHHEILLKINQVLNRAEKNDLVLIYSSYLLFWARQDEPCRKASSSHYRHHRRFA